MRADDRREYPAAMVRCPSHPSRLLRLLVLPLIAACLASHTSLAFAEDALVRLNLIRYLPNAPKRASIAAPCTTFRILRDADGIEVFTGKPAGCAADADTRRASPGRRFFDLLHPWRLPPRRPRRRAVCRLPHRPRRLRLSLLHRDAQASTSWRSGHRRLRPPQRNHLPARRLPARRRLLRLPRPRPPAQGRHGRLARRGRLQQYVINAGFTVGCCCRRGSTSPAAFSGINPLDIPESRIACRTTWTRSAGSWTGC